MSTRDVVQDIVKHTAGLGFITNVKVTGTDEATELDAMDADRTVIMHAELHNAEPDFKGEFGLGNLGFLAGVTGLGNYQADDATVEVVSRERNGVTTPDALMFRDVDGNTDQYRFMSKEIIEQTLQPNFTVKTEEGELIITVGAPDGSFTGKRTFAKNITGELNEGYAWPLSQVLAILKLGMSGACVMQISARGALQISVDSGIGKYDYILPALTV